MDESSQPAPPHPPFDPRRFAREMRIDAVMRTVIILAVAAAAIFVFVFEAGSDAWSTAAVLAVLAVWLGISGISAKASRALPAISAATEVDPDMAQAMIDENLQRRPLLRWVRLMLYHRLAVLRHRQERFGESAAICQAVLSQPMGPARQVRPHLLLMLVEARLYAGDLIGAYGPLLELYQTRLGLSESLQRLALQTQYEVMAARHDAALHRATQKIQLAELMPAPQCGLMHALLATAAHHANQPDLARWLRARAELLCTPEQLRHAFRPAERMGDANHPVPVTACA